MKSDCEKEKENMKKEIDELRSKVRTQQTLKQRFKTKLQHEKSTTALLLDTINADEEIKRLKLKEEKFNQYSDSVRLTDMCLQGQANVAASNCSKVIQIVAKYMFDTDLASSELPSDSTALNFADEAHHEAKHQIVESISNSNYFTLATDGTSRQKKHFIERHIVLDNGKSMSIGFTETASQTLLEKTIDMFNDLCDVYKTSNPDLDTDELLKEILVKLKCQMSDRASVMKLFDKKLAELKNSILGENTSTHFLFCNAHFLLGLSKATEEALSEIEESVIQEDNRVLGRDADGAFSSFSTCSESAACCLIRLAAEVLGPRGDEKNGCRED